MHARHLRLSLICLPVTLRLLLFLAFDCLQNNFAEGEPNTHLLESFDARPLPNNIDLFLVLQANMDIFYLDADVVLDALEEGREEGLALSLLVLLRPLVLGCILRLQHGLLGMLDQGLLHKSLDILLELLDFVIEANFVENLPMIRILRRDHQVHFIYVGDDWRGRNVEQRRIDFQSLDDAEFEDEGHV